MMWCSSNYMSGHEAVAWRSWARIVSVRLGEVESCSWVVVAIGQICCMLQRLQGTLSLFVCIFFLVWVRLFELYAIGCREVSSKVLS